MSATLKVALYVYISLRTGVYVCMCVRGHISFKKIFQVCTYVNAHLLSLCITMIEVDLILCVYIVFCKFVYTYVCVRSRARVCLKYLCETFVVLSG